MTTRTKVKALTHRGETSAHLDADVECADTGKSAERAVTTAHDGAQGGRDGEEIRPSEAIGEQS